MSARRRIAAPSAAALAVALAAAGWLWWPTPDARRDEPPQGGQDSFTATEGGIAQAAVPAETPTPLPWPETAEPPQPLAPRARSAALQAAITRACPWPPSEDTWRELDAECLEAWRPLVADDGFGDFEVAGADPHVPGYYGKWMREALDEDPLRLHRTVGEALDRPECRVSPTQKLDLTNLRETCAADDMVRLSVLQGWCRDMLEYEDIRLREVASDRAASVRAEGISQEEYYERMAMHNELSSNFFWGLHTCRSLPPEVLGLFDHLPEEEQDMELLGLAWRLGFPKPVFPPLGWGAAATQ